MRLRSPAVPSPSSVRTRRTATALPLARMRRRPAQRIRGNRSAAVSRPWPAVLRGGGGGGGSATHRRRRPALPLRLLLLLPPPPTPPTSPPLPSSPPPPRPPRHLLPRSPLAARRPGADRRAAALALAAAAEPSRSPPPRQPRRHAVPDAPNVRAPQNDAPGGKALASPAPFGARRLAGRDACAAVQGGGAPGPGAGHGGRSGAMPGRTRRAGQGTRARRSEHGGRGRRPAALRAGRLGGVGAKRASAGGLADGAHRCRRKKGKNSLSA